MGLKLIPAAHELISTMRAIYLPDISRQNYFYEEPLRSELFSSEQMERHGKILAESHTLSDLPSNEHLLKRLAANEVLLHEVRKILVESIRKKIQISPAGEWLIDNFYLLEEHIRSAKINFPKDYSEDLPQLLTSESDGLTRIYDIILQIISHSDGRIDIGSLGGFVKAYQSVAPLQLGELWAIPIMLRLGLIENLRRVSSRLAIDRVDRNLADYWAKQMLEKVETDPKNIIVIIGDMARSIPPMTGAFVSELTRQLRGKGSGLELALKWIDQQLFEHGLNSDELIISEIQKQTADQVSISNTIGSLRLLTTMDWRDFVETYSVVEKTLREDKDDVYGRMDFATRDRYRHVVEYIAKNSKCSEQEVARMAINLANRNSAEINQEKRTLHVGYYLIDEGVAETKRLAATQESGVKKIQIFFKKGTLAIYLASIFILATASAAYILWQVKEETYNTSLLLFIGFLAFICTSQLGISIVNFFSTLFVKPNLLPRMDFSKKVPTDCSTLVIVPALLSTFEEIESLTEGLEVRFLANRNENLHFGLLTDFTDAKRKSLPEDKRLLEYVRERIEELNRKYQRTRNDLFYLFHRPRLWNPQENAWMGYERKRGKLSELNLFLRGQSKDSFELVIGDQSILPSIKYVITLDVDTQLPLGSAWKLIGTMAHPLNHAIIDEKKKRVTHGYGILQPRITVSLPEIDSSFYARMHGNEPGIDPYTRASSDVYQDLFKEGSYIGKGIYDVDVFQKVLDGKFGDNGILSHDLLEGCYVRSGLLSDVQLFEKYPSSYQTDVKRNSRWVRGDWQILFWVLPFVPGKGLRWYKNPISDLSRWKILDNIRRSLVPIALTLLLILGWTALSFTFFWTVIVSSIVIFPLIVTSVWDLIKKSEDVILVHHLKNSANNIKEIFIKTLFVLICLPFEAFSNASAIGRTLWRMFVSKKKLLEWTSPITLRFVNPGNLWVSYSFMIIEPFIAIAIFSFLILFFPSRLFIAGPILALWFFAPALTWRVSKLTKKEEAQLTEAQHLFLRKIARKTWSFFERFVNDENNWLPPDNFQEQPGAMVAHRTSPTNIGLSLLANLTAAEFGYLTITQLLERSTKAITTLKKMERFKGHFYNWYDTQTLEPLLPRYISTVDSGNLAGYLLVFRQGMLKIHTQKIILPKFYEGLQDTVSVLADVLQKDELNLLDSFRQKLEACISNGEINSWDVRENLEILVKSFTSLTEKLNSSVHTESQEWSSRLLICLKQWCDDAKVFDPWVLLQSTPAKFTSTFPSSSITTLQEVNSAALELQIELNKHLKDNTPEENSWINQMQVALSESMISTNKSIKSAESLAWHCNEMADMDWDFLYDNSTHLFTIGYNVDKHLADESFYDLLASEVRLCIFICIAQGKLPEESWFALGRLLTSVNGNQMLLSWSGSMFEYLMPILIMPTYENTLLGQSCKAVVEWQIEYGRKTGIPWGISESGYNMISSNSNYQYRAFGAPGLGLKRGLEADLVIAPYATALALMVAPTKALTNLELLAQKGFEGRYGFYEAVDYTPSRLQFGQTSAIVYSFMAHHQGMSLLSFSYLLHDKPMQKLFEAEPQFQAAILLLQERIPKASVFYAHTSDITETNPEAAVSEIRIIDTPNTFIPEIQLMSNGRYHVMLSNAGGGYSKWKDIAVTRWREDGTRDNWGTFCYIRDLKNKLFWSNTHQPALKKSDTYEAAFSQGRVNFASLNEDCETRTEVVVSPEDDIELRRVTITNHTATRRSIEITSYAEVVLAPAASDISQPAFSNLFVQTSIIPEQRAIVCTRRPRSSEEKAPWMFHQMTMNGKEPLSVSYETDRMEFIGHGNTLVNPKALISSGSLSGKQGSVLDPIVAIRYTFVLNPEECVAVDLVTGISETREGCQHLIDKYQDKHHRDRVFELAWTHSQVVLRQINASESEAQLYSRLASSILFANILFRADPSILVNNHRSQSGLWGYSISGDLPIVLLKIEKQINMQMVKHLIKAHSYWRLKGLIVDLVIWNEEHNDYRQLLQTEIQSLIPAELKDKQGGIFLRAADQISNEDRILFQTVARINISDSGGTLTNQIKKKGPTKVSVPYLIPSHKRAESSTKIILPDNLIFFNKLGGFSPEGDEYLILISDKDRTPVPWVNVLANPTFGTVISESGTAYTWSENAHEFRLSPWNNDPVTDSGGEVFYIRDEQSGHFWSTTFLPCGGESTYLTRHGFGYSVFKHVEDGIESEMTVHVDLVSAIKFIVIKVTNRSGRLRKLSATGYTEWVLGNSRTKTSMHIHTEVDPDTGALFARNPYSAEFAMRVGFFDVDSSRKSFTCDRTEFLGRNGNLKNPDAMLRTKLSGKVGLALDPCAAIQVPFNLEEGEVYEVVFKLGAGKDHREASELAKLFQGNVARDSFIKVKNFWKHTIDAVHVETPDTAINILTNGWLTYQTLSSRLWGRSGFYQSGGAFGFRDQLQDVLSLLHAAPELAREQILLSASHQFKEGDVQHWWHPPNGRGVRTRCSDDLLWLPYVTSIYISQTGDKAILEELCAYLDDRHLQSGEESYYDLPNVATDLGKLYEHCVRAIKHSFKFGIHGLPLIGGGDWNDGFDKVGIEGKGESVWLAFFLYDTLMQFVPIAKEQNDFLFSEECERQASLLKTNINQYAWDGKWFKRAWFDDGKALGSSANEECQIDSISQSWAVLSGAGDDKYIHSAMESAFELLVQNDSQIVQLLEPPFDKSDVNPGYIKGYVPGVRENGGQYTHAAIWMIMAFAKLGDHQRVWKLLNIVNPINHGKTREQVTTYKVEPYVLAADVYARIPHAGRGGWTWYTGSASWLYRLIIEFFLGIKREGNKMKFNPCVPSEWESFKIQYRFKSTQYNIEVIQKDIDETTLTLNGIIQESKVILLVDDRKDHIVQIHLSPVIEAIAIQLQ